jgi:uncharacterized membrane protein YoaK (UPF0700 family)
MLGSNGSVSLRQRIAPAHMLGRTNAGYRLLAWGTLPLGAAAGGLLAELVSLRAVFGIAAFAVLALLPAFFIVTNDAVARAEGHP